METPSKTTLLSEQQRHLVELYAREPNPTKIAEILGIHRATVYRRLDEPGVQDAIAELRGKLDVDRNHRVEEAQDDALELISQQLKQHLRAAKENPGGASIADTKSLMVIAKELGAMKKDVKAAAEESIADTRRSRGEVDWDADPEDD